MTLVQIVRIPEHGVATFQRYESLVLPLLSRHRGRLERRLRNADGTVELHVLSFPSASDLDAYRSDPDRAAHLPLLEESGAVAELIEMADVSVD